MSRPKQQRPVLTLLAIFGAVFLAWNTSVVYPLKVLVVLLHEISHGAVAVATGGSIERIEINENQGGVCYTRGGVRFLTLSAGYLGSMAFGAALLVAASRSRHDRYICAALGGFLLLITVVFVRNQFGFLFGLLAGGALAVGALNLPNSFSDVVLRTIGVTSCCYALLDIKSDVLDRPGVGSDADMLAELTHLPSVLWGIVWILVAFLVTAFAVVIAARGEEPR